MLSKPLHTLLSAAMALGMLLSGCADPESADLESLGLAVAADIQPGERFELTAARDPDISVTSVSVPAGVNATVTEPDEQTVTLSVEVAPDTPLGTYTLLLRTDRNGVGAELEWPFEVIDAAADAPAEEMPTAEAVRNRFIEALAAKDVKTLESMWSATNWDTLGVDVVDWFVPAEPASDCQPFDDGRTTCFVFEAGVSRVLGLTMERSGPDGWTITAVSLDSTN